MPKRDYFISDLHLGASYIPDPREQEMKVVRFLRSVASDCERLFLLGDILDYWWEYKDVVPRGFTRFFGALAELADAGVEITWFKGNHDIWIFDYLPTEIGLTVHDGVLVRELRGKRFLMEHGDGVGRRPWTFRALRQLFRCRPVQRLYASLHPRLTVGFAHAWSSHSRKNGGYVPSVDPADSLLDFARAYNEARPPAERVDYFVFGHVHLAEDRTVPGSNARMVVLGDWIDKFTYATWDGSVLATHTYR